jgi:hypothetical protein
MKLETQIKLGKLTSEQIKAQHEKTKLTTKYKRSSFAKKQEIEFTHKMLLNSVIYFEKFGVLNLDEYITDEEIQSLEKLDNEISAHFEVEVNKVYGKGRQSTKKSGGNWMSAMVKGQ